MRIIAGEFKSRRLLSPPPELDVRPITDRVKESVFSILRGHCEGATVLDLFAGTGAIGLEALSRGAARCVFVEKDRRAAEILRRNIETLGATDRCEVVVGDALGPSTAARCPRPVTLVFMDPPYPLVEEPIGLRRVLAQAGQLAANLADDGFLLLRTPWPLLHHPSGPHAPESAAPSRDQPAAPTVHPDLRIPGAVGPETHTYGSMAIHFFMKAPVPAAG